MSGATEKNPFGDNDIEIGDEIKPTRFLGSSRFALCLTFMIGFGLFYAMRVDMSVAILGMVNHTAVSEMEAAHKQMSINTTSNETYSIVEAINPNCIRSSGDNESKASEDGPFLWDSLIQNQILGAFFIGYPILQVPGGWLAGAVGGRWIIFTCVLMLSIATIALPFIASSWIAVAVFRALQGLASGAVFPAAHAVISQWAPPLERSKITTIAYSGCQLGNVFTFPVSGLLIRFVSWEMVFYFWGVLSLLWLVLWFFFGHNNPSTHPRISPAEKRYIRRSLAGQAGCTEGNTGKLNLCSIPWWSFVKSPPVWGILLANFTSDWGAYTFLSQTPKYMKSVHHFDIASNSSMSALPYIGYWLVISISGPLADLMRERKCLSTVWTRRMFAITGFMLPTVLLIVLGYLSCEYWVLALIVLIIIISSSGLQYASWVVSHVDIAPQYAGILYGICNSISCASGIMTNTIAGLFMSSTPTLEEWRMLFFITAGVMAFGCLMYCILVRSEVQPWALDDMAKDEKISSKPEAVALTAPVKQAEVHA